MAKPKPKPQAKSKPKKRSRAPIPWVPILLVLAAVFGLWVAPALWDKAPLQVTFEDSK